MTDRVRLLLPAAFVAAAGALLAVLAVTARLGPLVALSGTEVNYAQAAVQLSQGHGYVDCPGLPIPWFPPGYAASLAVLIRAGLSVADATRWVGATAAAVLAFSIAWLAGRRLGGAVAVLTAWLVTLNPIMLRWEMELIADASHAAAVMAALALTLAYLRHRRRGWLVAAGAAPARIEAECARLYVPADRQLAAPRPHGGRGSTYTSIPPPKAVGG